MILIVDFFILLVYSFTFMPLLLRQDSRLRLRGALGDRETAFTHGNHRHDYQATDVLTCYFQAIKSNTYFITKEGGRRMHASALVLKHYKFFYTKHPTAQEVPLEEQQTSLIWLFNSEFLSQPICVMSPKTAECKK